MKKKSKILNRLFAVFVSVLCVCLLCVPAFAASSQVETHSNVVVVLEETKAASGDDPTFGLIWYVYGPVQLEVGSSYIIVYNGMSYECVCQPAPDGIVEDPDAVAIGNFASVGGEDTGEPFAIVNTNEMLIVLDLSGSYSVRVGISRYDDNELFVPSVMSAAGSVVTSLTSWIGSVARMVINEPVLLIGFTIALATLAFGIFKSLKR